MVVSITLRNGTDGVDLRQKIQKKLMSLSNQVPLSRLQVLRVQVLIYKKTCCKLSCCITFTMTDQTSFDIYEHCESSCSNEWQVFNSALNHAKKRLNNLSLAIGAA